MLMNGGTVNAIGWGSCPNKPPESYPEPLDLTRFYEGDWYLIFQGRENNGVKEEDECIMYTTT